MVISEVNEEVAGRELDALVAVRVIGWRYCKNTPIGGKEQGWLFAPDTVAQYLPEYTSESHANPQFPQYLPYYSTDIAAAMEVVEKTRERGLGVMIGDGDVWRWQVEFWLNNETEISSARADSLPEAICRAALQAIASS